MYIKKFEKTQKSLASFCNMLYTQDIGKLQSPIISNPIGGKSMSFSALRLNPDGTTTPVKGSEINNHNRYDCYVCDQTLNGVPCRARMVPWCVGSAEKETYFSSPYGGHLPNCDNDKSSRVRYRYYLSKYGKDFSSVGFFKKLGKKSKSTKKGTPPPPKGKGGRGADIPPDKEEKERPTRRRRRGFENLLEYYTALRSVPIDMAFSAGTIQDYILDDRTIEHYRTHDLSATEAVIVLCRKAPRDSAVYKSVKRGKDQILLMDAYTPSGDTPPISFLVTTGSKLGHTIISAVLDDKIVALFAPWDKLGDNLYVSQDTLSTEHVLILDPKSAT